MIKENEKGKRKCFQWKLRVIVIVARVKNDAMAKREEREVAKEGRSQLLFWWHEFRKFLNPFLLFLLLSLPSSLFIL